FLGDWSDLKRELRCSGQRVTPYGHGSRARVRLLSMKRDRMSLHALGPEHDAKRKIHVFENRPLLDMKFKISCRNLPLHTRVPDLLNLNTTSTQSLFQAHSVAIGPHPVDGNCMGPGKCR